MNTRVEIKELLALDNVGGEVKLSGWVRTRRDSKEVSFIEVNDGSCLNSLQVVISHEIADLSAISTGTAIEVRGELVRSPAKGQKVEVKAIAISILGKCDIDYPLQKKRHSFEFLRTISHLRARTNTFGAVFRVRSALSLAIHKFFDDRGFIYVHTPIITTSDCEGAGKLFQVTTLNLNKLPLLSGKTEVDYGQDFFGRAANLTVSGQLELETFACALSKVYTFGPTFRAENSNTPRHLAEFWMVEPEMAFCDLVGNMDLAEDFIKSAINSVLQSSTEDMNFFDQWVEKGIINSLQAVVNSNFERISYTEAIKILEKSGRSFDFPVKWGSDLQTEHERYLTDEYFKKPVFVTNYPKEIKAFYMRLDEGEQTVSAMDLLVPRLGEIIGGAQREDRYDTLLKRMNECQIPETDINWYVDLRKYGSIPHAGFGLGLERMVMYLTGMTNIRDVIPFARTPGNAEF